MSGITEHVAITPEVRREAHAAQPSEGAALFVRTESGEERPLPHGLQAALFQALEALAHGHSATLAEPSEILTSTEAAELLGVSRPTLLRWARAGRISGFTVGTHTRFSRGELLAFQDLRDAEQRAAFAELRALDDQAEFDAAGVETSWRPTSSVAQ